MFQRSEVLYAKTPTRSNLVGFRCFALLAAVVILACGLLFPGRLTAQEAEKYFTRTQFNNGMKAIRHFKVSELTPEQKQDTDVWFEGLGDEVIGMNFKMAQAYKTPNEEMRKMLFDMVEGMGHDDAADLRLRMCMGWCLNPLTQMSDDMESTNKKAYDHTAWLLSTVAEAQVRDWCQHPEKLERAAWFGAWLGEFPTKNGGPYFMISINPANTFGEDFRPAMDTSAGSKYWQYARLFVYSACLTNRRDFYAGHDPTKLQPQYEKFRSWFNSTGTHWERWRASGNSPTYIFDPEGVNRPKKDADVWSLPKLTVVPQNPYPTWGDLPKADPDKVWQLW